MCLLSFFPVVISSGTNAPGRAMFEGFYGVNDVVGGDRAVTRHMRRHILKRQHSRELHHRLIRSKRRRNSNTATLDQKYRQIKRSGNGLILTVPLGRNYEPYNNDDKQSTVKCKRYFPEDTYEHWHLEKELNKNVQRLVEVDPSSRRKVRRDGKEEDRTGTSRGVVFSSSEDEDVDSDALPQTDQEQEQEDDGDEDNITDHTIEERVRQKAVFIDKVSTRVIVERSGLEVLPYTPPSSLPTQRSISYLTKSKSYTDRHHQVLQNQLHLCVLRKKWELGYKVFTTLIRLPNIDVRNIWPQGLEILTRLAEQKYLEEHPDASDYTMRVFASNTESPMRLVKDEEFLQWIATFYPIMLSRHNLSTSKPFPFRKGSKLTVPVFVVTLVWTLLYKQKFEAANEKLSDLLLMSPYINDGVFHFLQGLSYQMEAAVLVQKKSLDKQKVEKLVSDATKFYQQAKVLGAVFPEKLINLELDLIRSNMEQPESASSDDEPINYDHSVANGSTDNDVFDEFGFDNIEHGFSRLEDISKQNDEDDYDTDD